MKTEAFERARRAFETETREVARISEYMDMAAFERAVDALARAERIAASGCGHSGIACRHFAHLMCCIELPARFISPSEAVHGGSGFIKKGDVLLLASRGGETGELIPIMDIAREKGAFIITVTENAQSRLAQGADAVIPMKIESETDKYNSQGTSSFIVQCSIFDSLQAALIEQTDYKNEQFARIHPGGAVGKRLNA